MPHKRLVIDANILIRAVFGQRVRELMVQSSEHVAFYMAEPNFDEACHYIALLASQRGIDEAIWRAALDTAMTAIQLVGQAELATVDYFASYLYLPRLRDKTVLAEAIREGVSKLFCEHFAYAEAYDEATGRYLGLMTSGGGRVVIDTASVIVRPEVARQQEEADQAARVPTPTDGEGGGPGED